MHDIYANPYSELYHHGILGQKWGVRRYQNPDGSLTEEGRIRYGYKSGYSRKMERKYGAGSPQYLLSRQIDSRIDKRYSKSTPIGSMMKYAMMSPAQRMTYETARAVGKDPVSSFLLAKADLNAVRLTGAAVKTAISTANMAGLNSKVITSGPFKTIQNTNPEVARRAQEMIFSPQSKRLAGSVASFIGEYGATSIGVTGSVQQNLIRRDFINTAMNRYAKEQRKIEQQRERERYRAFKEEQKRERELEKERNKAMKAQLKQNNRRG